MKKLLCFVLVALMVMSSAALADEKTLNPQENRGIKPQKVGLNEMEEGISPTTGLNLSSYDVPKEFTGMAKTGVYVPMMANIGNDDGGVGKRAQWGIAYADIIYEYLLYSDYGKTRLLALFNDVIPDSVGFLRSMRMATVWLREEWNAALMFQGQQTYEVTNTPKVVSNFGYNYVYPPFYNGWAGGKNYEKYIKERSGLTSPFHIDANAVAIYKLLTSEGIRKKGSNGKPQTIPYEAPNHAFKFTDETPEGDTALHLRVEWKDLPNGYKDSYLYGSSLIYDIDSGCYLRYMRYGEKDLRPWVDKDTGMQLAFANVIVQFVETEFPRTDAPVQYTIGKKGDKYVPAEGNADFFMAGKHISGYWKHESPTERTVFYGPDGDEISLQRGKTLIILYPSNNALDRTSKQGAGAGKVTYSDQLPDF